MFKLAKNGDVCALNGQYIIDVFGPIHNSGKISCKSVQLDPDHNTDRNSDHPQNQTDCSLVETHLL